MGFFRPAATECRFHYIARYPGQAVYESIFFGLSLRRHGRCNSGNNHIKHGIDFEC